MQHASSLRLLGLVATIIGLLAISPPAFAEHDMGQDKSRHPEKTVSVAADPATGLLFLAGSGLSWLGLRRRRRRDASDPDDEN